MGYGAYNQAFANIGNMFANKIEQNKQEELRQQALTQKAINDTYIEKEKANRQSQISNLIYSLLTPTQEGMIDPVSNESKLSQLVGLGGITPGQAFDMKAKMNPKTDYKEYQDKERGKIIRYNPENPNDYKEYDAPYLKKEKQVKDSYTEKVVNKDGFIAVERVYSDGRKNLNMTTKKWSETNEKGSKYLTPTAKRLFDSDFQTLQEIQNSIDLMDKDGAMLVKDEIVTRDGLKTVGFGEDGLPIQMKYIDFLNEKKQQIQNEYVNKVRSSLSEKAEKWYQGIYNLGSKGNPDPQDYWENLVNAYQEGQFDTKGTKQLEDDEDYTFQTLFELFRATYGFDPIKRYGL